jgi:hypothetical protein
VPLKLIDTVDDRAAGGDQSGRLALPTRCLPRSLRREEIEGSPDDEQLPDRHINFDAAIRSADARSAALSPLVRAALRYLPRPLGDESLHLLRPTPASASPDSCARLAAGTLIHDG